MLTTVEGVYKAGKIELTESPSAPEGTKVLVTFLPDRSPPQPGRMMTFGMLATPGARESTEEDFKAAEWHPKPEDLDLD